MFNIIKITFFTELGMYALAQAYIFRLITMIFSWTSVDYYIYRELSVATTQAPKNLGPEYLSKKLANQVDLQDQLLARNCVFIILRPEPSPYLHKIQYSLIYIILYTQIYMIALFLFHIIKLPYILGGGNCVLKCRCILAI